MFQLILSACPARSLTSLVHSPFRAPRYVPGHTLAASLWIPWLQWIFLTQSLAADSSNADVEFTVVYQRLLPADLTLVPAARRTKCWMSLGSGRSLHAHQDFSHLLR
jgi:hypothetical protein